ncbi:MAG: 3D domain-containing protein [Candidatus Aureabacteria bacterium]|nr:3D domain-containing protein [Candidatus Auribacterota bacterium]
MTVSVKSYFSFLFICLILSGCVSLYRKDSFPHSAKPQWIKKKNAHYLFLITTGYCPCQKCTGWKRNWKLQPVYKKGPLRGRKKEVGITSDGTKAIKGVIAADIHFYPYGTKMYIPEYGVGEVHDTGTGIKGKYHIDLFFPTHKEALKWGRRMQTIEIWNESNS